MLILGGGRLPVEHAVSVNAKKYRGRGRESSTGWRTYGSFVVFASLSLMCLIFFSGADLGFCSFECGKTVTASRLSCPRIRTTPEHSTTTLRLQPYTNIEVLLMLLASSIVQQLRSLAASPSHPTHNCNTRARLPTPRSSFTIHCSTFDTQHGKDRLRGGWRR